MEAFSGGRTLFRKKLLSVALWSSGAIICAMIADYVLTILILRDYPGYTPFETLIVATLVTVPITSALVNSHFKLRKALDDLAVSRDAAIEANLQKTHFFANVSHELRTPLNAILGFSELLGLDIFAGKRTEYARLIHDSGTHLLALVNDLLDLSRIEAGKFELQEVAVSLHDIAQECREAVEPRLRSGELRVLLTIPAELPRVIGDRRALKQILLNLLTNAIKFTMPGGSIEVFACLAIGEEWSFGVRDEGVGIAQDDLVKVFERFGQSSQATTSLEQGTGLGLPIVKGLAEAHGGRVSMESQLGSGTCVTIWLPTDRLESAFHGLAKAS